MIQYLRYYTDRLVDYTTPPQKPCELKKAVFPYVLINVCILWGAWSVVVYTRTTANPMPWEIAIPLSVITIAANSVLADLFVTLIYLQSSHIKKHQCVLNLTFSSKDGYLQTAEIHQTLKFPPRTWSYRDQALYRQLIMETKQKMQQEGLLWNQYDLHKKHKIFTKQFRNQLRHLTDCAHRNMFHECVGNFFVIKCLRKMTQKVRDFANGCFIIAGMHAYKWKMGENDG